MSQKYKLSLTVQFPDPRLKSVVPRTEIRRWVQSALFAPAALTIRFVDAEEGRTLNREYRGKDYATNVLTFAYNEDILEDAGDSVEEKVDDPTEADIVLCTDVVESEAAAQGKSVPQHAAHLIIHGVLHAQGYDHEDEEDAAEMEQIETELMAALKFPDPYLAR